MSLLDGAGSSDDMSDKRTRPARGRSGKAPAGGEDEGRAGARGPSPGDSDRDTADAGTVSDEASSVNEYAGPNASCDEEAGCASSFYIGMRLEVKDVANDAWYAAKVSEVDWGEKEVLIHFENWSHRFDEWLPVQSSRLRRVSKPEREKLSSPPVLPTAEPAAEKRDDKVFRVGDRVMATWNDCRRYSAKVTAILPNNRYQVVFYDGFSKNLRASKMSKLKAGQVDEVSQKGPPSSQEPFAPVPVARSTSSRHRPGRHDEQGGASQAQEEAPLDDLFPKKKAPTPSQGAAPRQAEATERAAEESAGRAELPAEHEKHKAEGEAEVPKTRRRSSLRLSLDEPEEAAGRTEGASADETDGARGLGRKRPQRKKGSGEPEPAQARKQRDSDLSKTKKSPGKDVEAETEIKVDKDEDKKKEKWQPEGEEAYIVEGVEGLRKSIIVTDERLPPGWSKHTIQRKSGGSAGKWDVFLVSPEGRKVRTRAELRQYFEEHNQPFPSERFDFTLSRKKGGKVSRSHYSAKSSRTSTGGKSRPGEDAAPPPAVPEAQVVAPKRIKTLLPRIRTPQPDADSLAGETPPPAPPAQPLSQPPRYSPLVAEEGEVFVGGLKIQMENNAFKCPKEGCGKTFRKENLLQMHLKHYHPEYTQFVASTPNVADLAYARTIGESLEELVPRARPVADAARRRPPAKDKPLGPPVPRKQVKRDEPACDGSSMSSLASSSRLSSGSGSLDVESQAAVERPPDAPATPDVKDSSSLQTVMETASSQPASATAPPVSSIKTLLPVVSASQTPPSPPQSSKEDADAEAGALEGHKLLGSPSRAGATHGGHKAARGVRKRNLSGPPLDSAAKKRKLESVEEEGAEAPEDESCSLDGFSPAARPPPRKKPVVDLHKLDISVDGSGCVSLAECGVLAICDRCPQRTVLCAGPGDGAAAQDDARPAGKVHKKKTVEQLRRDELINCTCGYLEEDGLMIQCDLCLCWQHGVCNSIEKEEEVPDKYVCSICLDPPRARLSRKYLHDQDWLKEGKLPSLSFRPKNAVVTAQREAVLRRSHELTGMLLQLQQAIHSLRVKLSIAEKIDHPKLYLWAKSWEKGGSKSEEVKQEDTEDVKKLGEKLEEEYPAQRAEEAAAVKEEEEPVKGEGEGAPVKEEDASLLHQALTGRAQDAVLQLPICQSELMRFASSMADRLQAAEGPRAPQPEAPIDPAECRLNLLDHINHSSQLADSRLSSIEAQIAALESQDADFAKDETPDFFPKTKQTVQMLMRDLLTMQRISAVS
ncbi:LOW QUALITY PROTEIN: PHD finger protein 20-like protein 1 [Bacillus rossius redtenbacheri]|uniref:LOW QUALITY PROTEIN: PHD finger protein 20-like protein 1 n=1 Tax=Bacillus rossius redtenbacheri TaxID=93214 RepID=UPI002FDC97F2